ncbi:hypothetical protein Tco_0464161 [Tanacetum coccineum]
MAAHTERMERFENTIFKHREEINDRMAEMSELLKELTTSRAPKKRLIREEAKSPVTKNVNSICLTRGEEERDNENDVVTGDDIKKTTITEMEVSVKEAETKNGAESKTKNKPIKKAEKEEAVEAPRSHPVEYYLKHRINEKLIEGLADNHRKKITRKEDISGNFKIPCNIGGLKHMNALVDQGSDVNIMPLSTFMKLTDERPAEMDIRLSLASHSYIYPLGIAKDILVEFDKGTITLRSRKSKISFNRIPESLRKDEKGITKDIEPIAPTMTVNMLVLEWEEKIKLQQEKVIFDEKKLGISYEVSLDDSWRTI